MKTNRIIASLLSAILCVNILFPGVKALAVEASNTIYVSSAEDLISLSRKCSLDTWSQGKTIILNNDIDLTGTALTAIPTFGGSFDGQGHTISGLSLTGYGSQQGLFRYVQEGALVKKLTVRGTVTPTGTKTTVGGVAGSNSGTLQNCVFVGTVRGDKYVGGIAGINEAKGLISNCSAQGIVYGEHYAGGIAGENIGTILLSSNTANVNTTAPSNSLSLEDIGDPEEMDTSLPLPSTEDIVDITDLGGIAGISSGIIQSCSNSGKVGYQHVGYNIGGIVGRQSGYINGCTNSGEVYGRKDVGGIAGQIEPYGTWQLSGDSLASLQKELSKLQSLINNTINDSKRYSSTISAQLSKTQGYINDAKAAGDSLVDQTTSWLNDNIGSINDVSARVTQILVALEPIMGSVSTAANNMDTAISQYKTAMQQLSSASDSAKTGMDTLYPALDKLDSALGDTKNAINNISAAISAMKAGLGDSTAVKNALSDMQTGIKALIAAMSGISDAANAMRDAANKLTGSEVWQENISSIEEGATELAAAADDMSTAMQTISDALTALSGDIDENELSAALTSLESALSKLATATEASGSAFSKISSGLQTLAGAYEDNEETRQAWEDIEAGMQTVRDAIGDGTAIDYEKALQGLSAIMNGLTVLSENTDEAAIQEGLSEIYEGVQAFSAAMEAMQAASEDLQDAIDHLQAANSDPEKTAENVEALLQGFADLAAAAQDASAALQKINTALSNLLQSDEVSEFGEALAENLQKISTGVSDAIGALNTINVAAEALSKQIDLDKLGASIGYINAAAGNISGAIVKIQSVISYVQNAWPYFETSADSASEALASAIKATSSLNDASAAIADSIEGMHRLISDLAAQPEIEFKAFDSKYVQTQDQLSEALGNISNSLSGLNSTLTGASAALLSDIQAVSDQMFVVFDLLVDAVENVTNISTDIKDYTEDISTQEAESNSGGKVSESVNHGAVQGDINVGGIAGSMAIEYDFDLEDDHNLTDKISPGAKYLLQAIVSGSENDGRVTAKKNCAGGIVGMMDFGYVTQSKDDGTISSTGGDYVGGIAGKSDGTIRQCYAKSALSGADYVGGIAGYATDLSQCYSLIKVESANEFVGAIAGSTAGTMKGNYFVHNELAGVDGISYAEKAEPISYETLLSVEGLPAFFKTFKLTFVADDQEVGAVTFNYGETIPENRIPKIPQKDGYFGKWDMDNFTNLTFDTTVKAEYEQYITSLASAQTRDNGPSVILVDGLFTNAASLTATETEPTKPFGSKQVLEQWTVSVSNDAQTSYTVRYLAPDRQTSGINIYILQDGTWKKTAYAVKGSYLLFDMQGQEATFIVTYSKNNIVLIILILLAVLTVIFTFLWIRRKHVLIVLRSLHNVFTASLRKLTRQRTGHPHRIPKRKKPERKEEED